MSTGRRIDPVPLRGVPGRLFACGFSAVGADPAAALESVDATTLVCLLTDGEIALRYPDYAGWLDEHRGVGPDAGPGAIRLPITDGETAADDLVLDLVDDVATRLRRGGGVVVHCGAGMARTAVVCVLTMVALGADLGDAAAEFRQARPGGGPDGRAQERQIARLSERLAERRAAQQPDPA